MANGKASLTLEQLRVVLESCTHEVPGDCWATGPLTGDVMNDLILCPGCAARRIIAEAIAEAERADKPAPWPPAPFWWAAWTDYPHTELTVKRARELSSYAVTLQDRLREVLDVRRR